MNPDHQVVLVGALILAAIAAYEVRYMWRERRAVAQVERLIADFDSATADALALAAEPLEDEVGPITEAAIQRLTPRLRAALDDRAAVARWMEGSTS